VPPKATFDEIMDLAVEMNVIQRRMAFEEYCDTRFAPDLGSLESVGSFPPPPVAEAKEGK
jgi:hypothetical protein